MDNLVISKPSDFLLNIIREVSNKHETKRQISVDTLLLITRKKIVEIAPLLTELYDAGYITIHKSNNIGKVPKLTDNGKVSLNVE